MSEGLENSDSSLLRVEREKQNLKIKDLSKELKISVSFLEALESKEYDSLPGPTYVKGYIRAYCKKLDLDPDKILKSYNNYLFSKNISKKKDENLSKRDIFYSLKKYKYWLFLSFLFILLAISNLFKSMNLKENKVEQIDIVITDQEKDINTGIKSKEKTLMYAEDAGLIPLQEEDLNIGEFISLVDKLSMNFIGESWVEVSDGNKSIEYSLKEKGSSLNIEVELPVRVLIGNVNNVDLFLNEEKVDLMKSYNKTTNVACIVLPSGTCNEFTISR